MECGLDISQKQVRNRQTDRQTDRQATTLSPSPTQILPSYCDRDSFSPNADIFVCFVPQD